MNEHDSTYDSTRDPDRDPAWDTDIYGPDDEPMVGPLDAPDRPSGPYTATRMSLVVSVMRDRA